MFLVSKQTKTQNKSDVFQFFSIEFFKMAKGRAEPGSSKWLANKMKAKGLQKLRWYCQMCSKVRIFSIFLKWFPQFQFI